MSSLEEVDTAVNALEKNSKSYALLHSNSSYPANEDELNLRVIPMLKERYNCVVGYSGHEYGLRPTYLATVLGAQIIERHVTIDRTMWGTDQSSKQGYRSRNPRKTRGTDQFSWRAKQRYRSTFM